MGHSDVTRTSRRKQVSPGGAFARGREGNLGPSAWKSREFRPSPLNGWTVPVLPRSPPAVPRSPPAVRTCLPWARAVGSRARVVRFRAKEVAFGAPEVLAPSEEHVGSTESGLSTAGGHDASGSVHVFGCALDPETDAPGENSAVPRRQLQVVVLDIAAHNDPGQAQGGSQRLFHLTQVGGAEPSEEIAGVSEQRL